jgi:SAM-dependent methyltransferase
VAISSSVPATEVDDFLSSTRFAAYQRVPLPHGREIPGPDRGRATAAALKNGVAGRSVLDVGTYYGFLPLEAYRRGARRVVGLEPDRERYRVARRVAELYGDRWSIVHATLEDYEAEEPFDIVTCLGVLHHVADPIAFLRRLAELTADELVVDFRLPDDPVYIRALAGEGRRLARLRAHLRSVVLRAAAGTLPIASIGDQEYHRVFYFSRPAFANLVTEHLDLFDSVDFAGSPTARRRVLAHCRHGAQRSAHEDSA